MYQEVTTYGLKWNPTHKLGSIVIHYGDGKPWKSFEIDSPEEFQALADMLRNEKPIFYDPETEFIATSHEIPGEGEELLNLLRDKLDTPKK